MIVASKVTPGEPFLRLS